MRLLEIVIPILLAIYLLWPHPRLRAIRFAPSIALVLTLLHLLVEGYRWQMIPLYVLTVLLTISSLIKIKLQADWPAAASYLTVILLAVSTALPVLLPVPAIPKPGGSLEVGTKTFELIDNSRKELYSGKDEARSFMVQVWYPANPLPENKKAPWMSRADIYGPAISKFLKLPSFFLDNLTLEKTPAYIDAPMAETSTPYPVILFSHGWNGFNAQNTGQMIQLASRGFVVVAVNHTYGAIATIFPDGRIAYNNPKALPDGAPDAEYEIAARKLVNQWAGDLSFTLDNLVTGEHLPANSLDFNRIGVYGHSTGGGAAIQFCGTDPRCKALLGMDPFMRPVSAQVLAKGVSQPSFFMFSQGWDDLTDSKNNQLFNEFYPKVSDKKGAIAIQGTKHYDFSDLPLLSPIAPQLGLKGPLNGKRVTEIVDAYLIEFFEMTLNGKPSNLFNGNFSDFPEVKIKAVPLVFPL
jgi:predicted dienelactone hydrolase